MGRALEGLRVVELSSSLPGALAGQLLADFGAEVVLVEPPGGHPLRSQPAFAFWARGKQSIELDLDQPDDRAVARSLCASSDVVVETFRPGVAERLGLGYEELAAENRRLVYTSITGFGRVGPYASLKGYEGLVAAKLGLPTAFQHMVARDGPAFVSVPYCSWGAAQTALQGTLAALHERERSGCGQRVDASLVQGLAAYDTWNWFVVLLTQRYPGAFLPGPPFDADGVPATGLYFRLPVLLTADGRWLQFSQTSPRLFEAFMRALDLDWMLGHPEWEGIPDFEDQGKRRAFWDRMIEAARSKTYAQWQQAFDADPDVWGEIFRQGSELLDHPQMRHDHQVVVIEDPDRGRVRQPGPLVRLDGSPAQLRAPAPRRNEHGSDLRASLHARDREGVVTSVDEHPERDRRPPLDGVTVLELGTFFAGPFGATLLADLGARVIKIEPKEGEPLRTLLPFPDLAAIKVLQGKESVVVDMTTDEGRAIVHALARRADIVLRSYRAGVAERHGVDGPALRAVNPDLIQLDAPGYGLEGPCGHRPAFAPTIGAGSGMARRNAGPAIPERADLSIEEIRRHSIRLSAAAMQVSAQPDGVAALGVATAMLLGLVARDRGAGGQSMLTTMLSTAAHALSEQMVEYEHMDAIPEADAELHGIGARYRLYEASDGWMFLAAPAPHEWHRLVEALAPFCDLGGDPRFCDEDARRANDGELAEELAATFRRRPAAEWERDLTAADVGCVAVEERVPEAVLLSEEFGRALGLVVDVVHPALDAHPRLAPLVRMSRSPGVARPAPSLGQHTDAVLGELGYSSDQIADLRARGVVA